jgi:tRNA threonylcarbamoyladenosine modification (KEOPS) complex Cgi121 subunit
MIATAIPEYLFSMDIGLEDGLNNCIASEALKKVFKTKGVSLSERINITKENENKWRITDEEKNNAYLVRGKMKS